MQEASTLLHKQSLLVLFSVSQQIYPLEFAIICNNAEENTCSIDELYDAVYSKIIMSDIAS